MKFVHGQPVCLGFIFGYMLHNAYQTKFIIFFKNMQFDIRHEAMKITWEDIDNCLKSLNNYVIEDTLWYGIGNDFEYSKDVF